MAYPLKLSRFSSHFRSYRADPICHYHLTVSEKVCCSLVFYNLTCLVPQWTAAMLFLLPSLKIPAAIALLIFSVDSATCLLISGIAQWSIEVIIKIVPHKIVYKKCLLQFFCKSNGFRIKELRRTRFPTTFEVECMARFFLHGFPRRPNP